MVSERKKKELEYIKSLLAKYGTIGLIDITNMPSGPLQSIRKALRGKALIRVSKKSLIKMAIEQTEKKEIKKLLNFLNGQPALLFSDMDAFKLYKMIEKQKSPAEAKEGDIAPSDIVVKAGPTPVPAGPAIGEFQKLKIPTMVKDGKIHIREDKVLLKKGEAFNKQIVSILKKLGIKPMEIGMNVVAVYQDGIVYPKDILAVDEEAYKKDLQSAFLNALNLSVSISYPTKENIEILIVKAFSAAKNLGLNAKIFEKDVIEDLLKKAFLEAQTLKNEIKI